MFEVTGLTFALVCVATARQSVLIQRKAEWENCKKGTASPVL